MSKRAEEAAMKAYPVVMEEHTERDLNKPRRLSYIKGYEQAEKDLALTWEDISEIAAWISVCFTNCKEGDTSKEIYEEALRRFNESKNKK